MSTTDVNHKFGARRESYSAMCVQTISVPIFLSLYLVIVPISFGGEIFPEVAQFDRAALKGPVHTVTSDRTVWRWYEGQWVPTTPAMPTVAETRVVDRKGNLIARGEPNGRLSIECVKYDQDGRKIRREQCENGAPTGVVTDYRYNEIGLLVERNDIFSHDPLRGRSIIYRYDASGRLIEQIERQLDNTVLTRFVFAYDSERRQRERTTYSGNEVKGIRIVETFDEQGNITLAQVFDASDGQSLSDTRYVYDRCGNPVEVVSAALSIRLRSKRKSTYEYDAYGNWIVRTTVQQSSILDKSSPDMRELTQRIITYYSDSPETIHPLPCTP